MTLSQRGEVKTNFFVKKQDVRSEILAPGPPAPAATALFPRVAAAAPGDSAICQRAQKFCGQSRVGQPILVPTEWVSAFIIDLPTAAARQRGALLAYAVEDKIAQPIESVIVAQARLQAAPPGRVLALVVAQSGLTHLLNGTPDSTAMPDMLLIRRPDTPPTGVAWAVWREGARAVVRVSDGTGFAINVDMLPAIWARAGRPLLTSLGAALPTSLIALDLSDAPPDPDPADLSFRFPTARTQEQRQAGQRPLIAAGLIMLTGLAALLGLAIADTVALGRIAATERATAQVALSEVLPGIELGPDVTPILARLTPAAPQSQQGAFLPLLAAVSAALAEAGPEVSIRRLTWGEDESQLVLNVQAAGLDDLQTIQQHLTARGFTVTSGAANAGDGGAEVDLTITGLEP